jgi:energy-coupling factor transport system substrate-specific component
MKDWLIRSGTVIIALVSGLAALTAPFFLIQTSQGSQPFGDRTEQLPITMTVVLLLSLLILVFETQYQLTNPRVIALLGVLAALNATLRFVEIAIPGPGGFSPIFLLIICCGYVFGGSFGFLLGILTMVVSAVVTGGIGPWLPAQMYTAGWVGLSAPLLAKLTKTAHINDSRWETILLAVLAGVWGFLFGLIMNLWFWPYMSGPADMYMTADVGIMDIIQRFSAFYLTTSLGWDVFRFIGNVLLLLLFARPILKTLNRYKARFTYSYSPMEQV